MPSMQTIGRCVREICIDGKIWIWLFESKYTHGYTTIHYAFTTICVSTNSNRMMHNLILSVFISIEHYIHFTHAYWMNGNWIYLFCLVMNGNATCNGFVSLNNVTFFINIVFFVRMDGARLIWFDRYFIVTWHHGDWFCLIVELGNP